MRLNSPLAGLEIMGVDHEKDLLLLTCASGKQCSSLLPHLYGKWKRLRLVVNSASSEERLRRQYPEAEVVRADLAEPRDTGRLMKGVTAVVHIGPSYHPHEAEIGYNMIDAAVQESRRGSFKHFVYSSVLSTQLRKMMNHDCKRYVEEYLMESGLLYSILKPGTFMDNFPLPMLLSEENPVYPANWSPDVAFSFCALRDFAEVTANVLDQREKHFCAEYALVSTPPITSREVVRIVSEEIGKDISIRRNSFEDATEAMLKLLFGRSDRAPPRSRDAAQRMVLFYDHYGLVGNPSVMEWLLGRKPTTHAEWARLAAAKEESEKRGMEITDGGNRRRDGKG